jgi:hypothetical protein
MSDGAQRWIVCTAPQQSMVLNFRTWNAVMAKRHSSNFVAMHRKEGHSKHYLVFAYPDLVDVK